MYTYSFKHQHFSNLGYHLLRYCINIGQQQVSVNLVLRYREFKSGYLDLLRRQFGTKRVKANQVYQDYINDRDHVHMNSTQWETLTEFIKWLGREGLCVVDETEKGWFIQYVDRDPETLRKMEASKSREKHEKDDEERTAAFIQVHFCSHDLNWLC